VKIAEDAMHGFSLASEPGAFWVDSFPILRHVPSWFPGAGFKTIARGMREDLERLYDVPFDFVRTKMVRFFAFHTRVAHLIQYVYTVVVESRQGLAVFHFVLSRREGESANSGRRGIHQGGISFIIFWYVDLNTLQMGVTERNNWT
jgi:hypothetical protein